MITEPDMRYILDWVSSREAICPVCVTTRPLIDYQLLITSVPRVSVTITCTCGYTRTSFPGDVATVKHRLNGLACACGEVFASGLDTQSLADVFADHQRQVHGRKPYWPDDPDFDRATHRWTGTGCACSWSPNRPDWDEHAHAEAFDDHALDVQTGRWTP